MLRYSILVLATVFFYGNCKHLSPRIVGGSLATVGQFPFIVSIQACVEDLCFGCGGSIISRKIILTAAHCVEDQYYEALDVSNETVEITVKAGSILSLDTDESDPNAQVKNVDKIIMHPNYIMRAKQPEDNKGILAYDIALLRLDSCLNFTLKNKVNYVPLVNPSVNSSGDATVSGWGYTDVFSSVSKEFLRYAEVKILDFQHCLAYRNSTKPSQMCAFKYTRGFCGGDSGGPLIVNNDNNGPLLVGVVSHTLEETRPLQEDTICAVDLDFYTSVSKMRIFIDRSVRDLRNQKPDDTCTL